MSFEAIQAIGAAEEAAESIRVQAEIQAKKIIADAKEAGDAAVAASIEKAKAEVEGLLRAADEKARERTLEQANKTENKKAAVLAHAESRLEAAASYITERIVSS